MQRRKPALRHEATIIRIELAKNKPITWPGYRDTVFDVRDGRAESGRFSLTKATRLSARLPVLSITKASPDGPLRRRAVQLRFLRGAKASAAAISPVDLSSNERKGRRRSWLRRNQEIPFAGVNLSSRTSVYRGGIEIVRRQESGKYRTENVHAG